MNPELEHVQRSRRLIADFEAPAQPPSQSLSRAADSNSGLNEDQELAVDRCDFLKPALLTTQRLFSMPSLPFLYIALLCFLSSFS